jgi:dolichol-phosphate mannosyltransferase
VTDPQEDVEISVVLPMYNEQAVAERAVTVVREQLQSCARSFEVVCVDDGSRDETAHVLRQLAAEDRRVRVVELSRNFGKEAALAAGLGRSRGAAVLLMDADLQHPPELIPRMIDLWDQGYHVVSGVKERRARESLAYRGMARTFNALMGGAAGASFQGASDFKLLDRQVVDALLACPERGRFFRGLVAWVGFKTAEVPFTVAERVAGESKWSTLGLVRYSVRNLLAFSALPLKVIAVLGFGVLLFSVALGAWSLFRYVRGDALTGFTTVILLQVIIGGLLLASVGTIALYLAEMYDELKRRPLYLIRGDARRSQARPAVAPRRGAPLEDAGERATPFSAPAADGSDRV